MNRQTRSTSKVCVLVVTHYGPRCRCAFYLGSVVHEAEMTRKTRCTHVLRRLPHAIYWTLDLNPAGGPYVQLNFLYCPLTGDITALYRCKHDQSRASLVVW